MSRFALKRAVTGFLLVAATAGAAGCAYYPEKQDFGHAVRHVQTLQTASPGTSAAPQDGERARTALQVYREDIAKPQEIRNEIVINVGN